MRTSFKQISHENHQNQNRNSVNNFSNGLYITSSKELHQSGSKTAQNNFAPISTHTPTTTKSSRGASPPNSRKSIEDKNSKCITGEECLRQKRIQLQNQQQLDQQKNILDEFLKYNTKIQKTSEDYINTRKQWNKQYSLAKNKRIINIKDDEEQYTVTIAKYMIQNGEKSFEEQLNDSIHPSLRSSPQCATENGNTQGDIDLNFNQKENINPSAESTMISSEDKQKNEQQQHSSIQQSSANSYNTPLKIYQNNKVYKNQYAQKISNETTNNNRNIVGPNAQNQAKKERLSINTSDNPKIKYIDTDLGTFYMSPFMGGTSKTPKRDVNSTQTQQRKQRASSVVTRRPNSQQQLSHETNNKVFKAKMNLKSSQTPTEEIKIKNISYTNVKDKQSDKLQLDDFSTTSYQPTTPLSTQNISKPLDSFYDQPIGATPSGIKLFTHSNLTTNTNTNTTRSSSIKQKDSQGDNSICQTEPNNLRVSQKFKNRNLYTNQTVSQNSTSVTEPDGFLITDYQVYNSKISYKNNGRRFKSTNRAQSQQYEQPPLHPQTTQISSSGNSNHSINQQQLEPLIKTEDISVGQRNSVYDSERQTRQIPLHQTQMLYNSKVNQENQGENKKFMVGSILRKEYDNRMSLQLQQNNNVTHGGNEFEQNIVYTSPNNQFGNNQVIHFNNISQNESQLVNLETGLSAYQYIEKLKREKRRRYEEEHKRFLAEKQKMNDQFNDFCVKRQLTNQIGSFQAQDAEGSEVKSPIEFYQAKNNIKMQEISQRCQKIYDECISQLQFPSQIFPNQEIPQITQVPKNQVKQESHLQIQKHDQIETGVLTLPRLSPINSTKNSTNINNSTKFSQQTQHDNGDQKANNIQQKNPSLYKSTHLNQIPKGNRSASVQPQSNKQLNNNDSKPITISMQKYLNDSAKGLNTKSSQLSSNQQIDSNKSKDLTPLDTSVVINDAEPLIKLPLSPSKFNNKSNLSSKKKIVKIKNNSSLLEQKDTLSSKKKQQQQQSNKKVARLESLSLDKTITLVKETNKDEKKNISLQNQSSIPNDPKEKEENKYATKINLNIHESLSPSKEKTTNKIDGEGTENLSSPNQANVQTPKSILSSPKSILKPSKNWSESPTMKKSLKEPQDFTLGYDSQIKFYQDSQMQPSQPTHYTSIHEKKKIIAQNNHILEPLNLSSPSPQKQEQSGKKQVIANNTQFIREEGEADLYQRFSLLQETDAIYRVQMGSPQNSLKFSQDFGYNINNILTSQNNNDEEENEKDNNSPTQSRFSFQYNQITEVSNTDDEHSQQHTKNLLRGSNQESKFTFLNSSSPDIQENIKESRTNFSQKILIPMSMMHQSKIFQDSTSPTSQTNQLLLEQLSKLKSQQNSPNENAIPTTLVKETGKEITSNNQSQVYSKTQQNSSDNIKQGSFISQNNQTEQQKEKPITEINDLEKSNITPIKQAQEVNEPLDEKKHIKQATSQLESKQQGQKNDSQEIPFSYSQNKESFKQNQTQNQGEKQNSNLGNKMIQIPQGKASKNKKNSEETVEQNQQNNQELLTKQKIKKLQNIRNPQIEELKKEQSEPQQFNEVQTPKKQTKQKEQGIEESHYVIDLHNESYSNGFHPSIAQPMSPIPSNSELQKSSNDQNNNDSDTHNSIKPNIVIPLIIDPFFI